MLGTIKVKVSLLKRLLDELKQGNGTVVKDDRTMIHTLEKATGSFEALAKLYTDGATGKTKLSKELRPCYETMAKTLEKLKELGLITATNETKFPFRQIYKLTDEGRRLVETPLSKWPTASMDTDDFDLKEQGY